MRILIIFLFLINLKLFAQCSFRYNGAFVRLDFDSEYFDIAVQYQSNGHIYAVGYGDESGVPERTGIKVVKFESCGKLLDSFFIPTHKHIPSILGTVNHSLIHPRYTPSTLYNAHNKKYYLYDSYSDSALLTFTRFMILNQDFQVIQDFIDSTGQPIPYAEWAALDSKGNYYFNSRGGVQTSCNRLYKWDIQSNQVNRIFSIDSCYLEMKPYFDEQDNFYFILSAGPSQNVIRKYSPDLKLQWEFRDSCKLSAFQDMLIEGNTIYLAGSTCKSQAQTLPCIYVLDTDGKLLRKKTYTNPILGLASDFKKIIRANDGNLVLVGPKANNPQQQLWPIYLTKLNQNLDTIWERKFNEMYGVYILSLREAADGGFLITYNKPNSSGGSETANLIRTAPNGLVATDESSVAQSNIKVELVSTVVLDKLELNLEEERREDYSYEIVDLQGKTVKKNKLQDQSSISVDELNAGFYFLRIRSLTGKSSSLKFLKMR
ncbi:MAG TPA: T9SS type A sorting domain-containing protein [Saprospiraceae bacterium]|nr:T9SS type A sorting domain-containing protein [Saprospiraceae bacterium]